MNDDAVLHLLVGLLMGFFATIILVAVAAVTRIDNLNKQVREQQQIIYQTYNVPIIKEQQ